MPINFNQIDKHVGRQLRFFRELRGMSQTELGKYLGVSFQQVQKYERGTNRVSASKLWVAASVLEITVADFYNKLGRLDAASPSILRETKHLVGGYSRIADPKVCRKIRDLVRVLGETDG